MRLPLVLIFVVGILVPVVAVAADDDAAAVVAKQKQAALANSRTLQMAPLGKAESAHFLLFGVSTDARLKMLAGNLERQFAAAFKALQFDRDDKPWTGKLTVYVFTDRGQFRSFVRQIEKRSPDDGDQSSASVQGDLPHIGVASGQGKDAVTADTQAGYEVAKALMAGRAKGTQLPEWLTLGFARATVAQAANTPAGVRKRIARQLAARV